MKLLEDRILKDGRVFPGNVLKVGSFLNQMIDVELLEQMGKEIYNLFKDFSITKVLTIETSGIPIACAAAKCFSVPVLFAKKEMTSNIDGDVLSTEIHSFTHGNTYTAVVSKEFLKSDDKVLIVDDFLADGNALIGLIDLCSKAGAEVKGCAVAIEKCFQGGGKRVEALGIRLESLARIESMSDSSVIFK